MKHLILLSILLFMVLSLQAQSQKHSLLFSTRMHLGSILAHSKELPNVQQTYPWGLEIDLAWQLQTENVWQYCYCFPKTGLSFFYTNFDNPSLLGSSFAVYPFIEPTINAQEKWSLFLRFGAGPNYLNNVYDSIDNPTNNFFSSPISFIVVLGAGAKVRVKEHIELRLGGIFNHISNGGLRLPNKGINFPTLFFGLDYRIRPVPFADYSIMEGLDLTPRDSWWEITTLATAKTDIKGYARYPVYGIGGGYYKTFGRLNAWNISMEFVSDHADKQEIKRRDLTEDGKLVDHHYGAVFGGYNLLLGVFRFSFQMGAYIYSPFDRGSLIFQRYGINILLFDKIQIGTNLKANVQIADFLDFRLGLIL
ncbi:MAG TPA: hypothetical protein DDX98_05225 [Bacteroidales bacterium]|nr:hypothetical protein [Bacteroidales bacterium]